MARLSEYNEIASNSERHAYLTHLVSFKGAIAKDDNYSYDDFRAYLD